MKTWAISLALAGALLAASSALAETAAPQPAPSSDAAFDAQKTAFLALPEATRRAIQDSLVWLGFYNGTSDGVFGRRTRDAIVAWQGSVKATADGALGPSLVRALLAAGDKARAAAGFEMIADPKTGARIGAPTKLLARGAKLDFASDSSGDLAALYARLSADAPGRKVAYKAIKPDAFLVVSGEEGGRKFYARYDKKAGAEPPIRGFAFSYPVEAASDLDRVAIAVANSFEPFPVSTPAPSANVPAARSAPRVKATALIVAPGRALSALRPDACANPSVGGKSVRFERADSSGLALLAGDFGEKGETPALGGLAPDLVAMSAGVDRVSASAVSLAGARKPPAVVAALDEGGSGAPVFDRSGRLAGLIAPLEADPARVGGVALASPHTIIDAEAIGAFLGGGGVEPLSPPRLTAGALAEREKGRVVAVTCGE